MKILKNAQKNKKYIFEIIIVSIILSLIVNLVSYGLCELFDLKEFYLYIGLGILIVTILSFFIYLNKISDKKIKITGFYLQGDKNNTIIEVPLYDISSKMKTYLDAACNENKAIKKLVENDSFNAINIKPDHTVEYKKSEGLKLFEELILYCILQMLTSHTNDYFNQYKLLQDKKISHITRSDISQIVVKNRFLRLFSEPMTNREKFITKNTTHNSAQKENAKIIAAYNEGAIFENFELNLPSKSKIQYIDENTYKIDMKLLSVSIHVNCEGFSAGIPVEFLKYYFSQPLTSDGYIFEIELKIHFKKRFLFKKIDSTIYNWFDSFLDIINNISQNKFYENINWNELLAEIIIFNNLTKSKMHLETQKSSHKSSDSNLTKT